MALKNNSRSGNVLLAALSVMEAGYEFDPVQVQKILFLLTDKAGKELKIEKSFNFVPYNYGPYDRKVYSLLEDASEAGSVRILPGDNRIGYQGFKLTDYGHNLGQDELGKLDKKVRSFVRKLVKWVTSCSFQNLVRAVYAAYPEMQENSVFSRPSK